MHPMLMAELANGRQSELLRRAESLRRTARSGGRRRPFLGDAAGGLTRAMGRLRHHPAATTWPAAADHCCA